MVERPQLGKYYLFNYDKIAERSIVVRVTDVGYGHARVTGWMETGKCVQEWAKPHELSPLPGGVACSARS